ncbi:MAG: hypothetical protein IJI54_10865 [Kiritimatiellae bacterium]|nr:hypothetical protein [Kiritimatiellia bacterium]
MERDEKGALKWVHAKHLYRDWSSIKACLIAFTIAPAIAFVFFTVVCGFADGFSLSLLSTQGKIWGLVFLIFMALLLPSYYLWAWAHGGVDEWEYEMDARGIKGRKIAHNQGRLKFLRSIAWIMMLFPMKPGQRVALNNFLYDKGKKEKYVDLIMLKDFICDERRGSIAIDTLNGAEEIYVPREVYAEVVAFIGERKTKRRTRSKPRA